MTTNENTPEVVKYLRKGGALGDLLKSYAIKATRHKEFPNLVLLKYNQIDSPMGVRLVQECRGLILDEANDWNVVSRPFDKFFNYGEGHAASINWRSAQVQEKLDGSLMQLYWYQGAWRVATSGMPDASGEVNGCGFTFAELFWRVWKEKGYALPDPGHMSRTFLFELMTPYNRVVVPHKENRLVLIGVRERNGDEYNLYSDFFSGHGWERVRFFPLQTVEDVEATFRTMDPLHQEGYVVVDNYFDRVKVKHPGYVAIHQLRDGFGPKHLLEVIRSGEKSELLTYYPEWTEHFRSIEEKYVDLVVKLELDYVQATMATACSVPMGVAVSPARLQKEFASHAVKSQMSGALFSLRAGKVASVKQYLAEMNIKSLMEALKMKDDEPQEA